MIIYEPTRYKVELQKEEIETIKNCQNIINDILDALCKRNCSAISTTYDVEMTYSKLEEISNCLEDLADIEDMYQGVSSPFWAGRHQGRIQ